MNNPRLFILINLAVCILYTLLYYLFSNEWREIDFPVQLAVYVSVHGIGLLILGTVQSAMKEKVKRNAAMLSGLAVLVLGWVIVVALF